jgi:hypothetical protein
MWCEHIGRNLCLQSNGMEYWRIFTGSVFKGNTHDVNVIESRNSAVIIAIALLAGWSFRIPVGLSGFTLLQKFQTGSGAHPAIRSMGTAHLFLRSSGRGVNLKTRLHLMPTLRMSGAKPLLPCRPS